MTFLAPASSRAWPSSGVLRPSADLAGKAFADHFNKGAVVALTHGGVEIDELDHWVFREAVDPVLEVVEGEGELFAADELHDAAAHEVDCGDEHLFLSFLVCHFRRESAFSVLAPRASRSERSAFGQRPSLYQPGANAPGSDAKRFVGLKARVIVCAGNRSGLQPSVSW